MEIPKDNTIQALKLLRIIICYVHFYSHKIIHFLQNFQTFKNNIHDTLL